MQHPNKEQQENQRKLLAQLPEEEREEHARLLRFGNAAYIYHQEANKFEPTKKDFEEWLIGLPENVRKDMKNKGFEECKGIFSFTRYVMEKNDIGMELWMKEHLNESDFKAYQKL
jgi:hypothetical protein